jgi:hypothetical protein
MKLRRLRERGIQAFAAYLDSLKDRPTADVPRDLLTNPEYSETVVPEIEIDETRTFGNRLEAAKYLYERLSSVALKDVERDNGLWTWLTLLYFDELCPKDESGNRKPGARARYIPEPANFQRYYRHLLAGPYRIYRAFRDAPARALVVLCQPLDKPGDLVEQLVSRQEIVTNPAAMEAATFLYIDPATRTPKRGASAKTAGAARRLADVLLQFDCTYDLYAMTASELLDILPGEFDKFRPSSISNYAPMA